MIPLIISGAVGLATDVVDAWKAHSDSVAMTKAVNGADFQQSLTAAATKAVNAIQQQQQTALPSELKSVTEEILQGPQVQSMAHANPTGNLNLQFNSAGDLFATQASGGIRSIAVSPQMRQELQQLNNTMRHPPVGAYAGAAQVTGEIGTSKVPVQVTLAAV